MAGAVKLASILKRSYGNIQMSSMTIDDYIWEDCFLKLLAQAIFVGPSTKVDIIPFWEKVQSKDIFI